MTLPPSLAAHKTLLVALVVIARTAAENLGVKGNAPVSTLAAAAGIKRTYVYEVIRRVLAALERLAGTTPGRPCAPSTPPMPGDPATELTIAVLRYQIEHPGAVIASAVGVRADYSPPFRRFILERHDAWPSERTFADFARAAEIPLDTLRDWIDADRKGLTPPPPPPPTAPKMPADAARVVCQIAELFSRWEGSTRAFLRYASQALGLLRGQVFRVLILLCLVSPPKPRHLPGRPRFRGETVRLSPGAVLVTDGKTIDVELRASATRTTRTWQPMVDQASACVTGSAVSREECAQGAIEAYRRSLTFLGGRSPQTVLHDGKPCYQDPAFEKAIAPAKLIQATPCRGENKAVIEGLFGAWEQQVGSIRLDDSSTDALVTSAVHEAVRAYVAGINHAGRAELDGKSRADYLRRFVPAPGQIERDRRFLRDLQARHQRPLPARQIPESRRLLDEAFARHECLRTKDRCGSLRRHLAYCSPSAVRQALAIFTAKAEQNAIDATHAHRFLAALVKNCQHEHDLQHCEAELLELTEKQGQWWTAALESDLDDIRRQAPSALECAKEIAARAAYGGLPVEGAFWTKQLLASVRAQPEIAAALRQYLARLYEAPAERRLSLIDLLAAVEAGLR